MKKPPGKGGPRKGAGRKPGKRLLSRSVSMTERQWRQLDILRGEMARGKWIAKELGL